MAEATVVSRAWPGGAGRRRRSRAWWCTRMVARTARRSPPCSIAKAVAMYRELGYDVSRQLTGSRCGGTEWDLAHRRSTAADPRGRGRRARRLVRPRQAAGRRHRGPGPHRGQEGRPQGHHRHARDGVLSVRHPIKPGWWHWRGPFWWFLARPAQLHRRRHRRGPADGRRQPDGDRGLGRGLRPAPRAPRSTSPAARSP